MPESAPDDLEEGSIEEGLYCLHCTYNLRGLSGDPVRCPECGTRNELADLRIPAEVLEKHLRGLETLPTICIAAMWSIAAGTALLVPGGMLCGVILVLPAPFVWVWAIYQFGAICSFKPRWLAVLGWYHLAGVAVLLFVVAVVMIGEIMDPFVQMFGQNRLWRRLLELTFWVGSVVLSVVFVHSLSKSKTWNLYLVAKRKLHVFCREVAVKRIRSSQS